MERAIPTYGWLRDYRRSDLASDLSAALVITTARDPPDQEGCRHGHARHGEEPRGAHGTHAKTVEVFWYLLQRGNDDSTAAEVLRTLARGCLVGQAFGCRQTVVNTTEHPAHPTKTL